MDDDLARLPSACAASSPLSLSSLCWNRKMVDFSSRSDAEGDNGRCLEEETSAGPCSDFMSSSKLRDMVK